MQVRILTYHMETNELKNLIKDIGNTVHSMNTIAVALSIMPETNFEIPQNLDISWKPKEIDQSKIRARNFAERSSYVYVAESLFEYLEKISKNSFWGYPNINFKGEEKKAIRVYKFLSQIPNLEIEMVILAELLCHWRNKVVHESTSNADLSSKKKDLLIKKKKAIYDTLHHFDTEIAIENYINKKVTLKDVSTLTTIVIKCCRAVDKYYFEGIAEIKDFSKYKSLILENESFKQVYSQSESEKRSRQIEKWINLNYYYIGEGKIKKLLTLFS